METTAWRSSSRGRDLRRRLVVAGAAVAATGARERGQEVVVGRLVVRLAVVVLALLALAAGTLALPARSAPFASARLAPPEIVPPGGSRLRGEAPPPDARVSTRQELVDALATGK